jgi:virginiamycin B lyase
VRTIFLAALLVSARGLVAGQEVVEFALSEPNLTVEGLAVGPDGNVWFTENASQFVGRLGTLAFAKGLGQISASGEITEVPLSGPGVVLGAFNAGPVLGSDGNFWFADIGFIPAQAAIGWSTSTGAVTGVSLVANFVSSLTEGPDGNIWFATSPDVGRITTSGVVATVNLPPGSGPQGIAAGSDGNLWYTDPVANQIGRMTTGGVVTTFAIPTANSSPMAITAGPDGALWFVETKANQIGRSSTAGVITEFTIPTQGQPQGIASGSDGNVWFTEAAGKVAWITTSGVISELVIPVANAFPTNIVATPDGHVWFVDGANIGRITPAASCHADAHTLCLNSDRFSVTADFQPTPEGPSTPATAVPLTPDTGYFWFFDPSNVELVTKVLDGCSTNGNFWFFASGLTNVGVQITVTDTLTGASKPYSNAVGAAFPPIQDTAAFPCP